MLPGNFSMKSLKLLLFGALAEAGAGIHPRQSDDTCCFGLVSVGSVSKPITKSHTGFLSIGGSFQTAGFCFDKSTKTIKDGLGHGCFMRGPKEEFECYAGLVGAMTFGITPPGPDGKSYLTYDNGPGKYYACSYDSGGDGFFPIFSASKPDTTGCISVALALQNVSPGCVSVFNVTEPKPTLHKRQIPPRPLSTITRKQSIEHTASTSTVPAHTPVPIVGSSSSVFSNVSTQLVPNNASTTTFHVTKTASHVADMTSHVANTTSHGAETTSHATDMTSHVVNTTSHGAEKTSHVVTTSHVANTTSHVATTTSHVVNTVSHITGTISHAAATTSHAAEPSKVCSIAPSAPSIAPIKLGLPDETAPDGIKDTFAEVSITSNNTSVFMYSIPSSFFSSVASGSKPICALQFRMPVCSDLPSGYPCYSFSGLEQEYLSNSGMNFDLIFDDRRAPWNGSTLHQVTPGDNQVLGTFECGTPDEGGSGERKMRWRITSVRNFGLEFLHAGVGENSKYQDGIGAWIVPCQ